MKNKNPFKKQVVPVYCEHLNEDRLELSAFLAGFGSIGALELMESGYLQEAEIWLGVITSHRIHHSKGERDCYGWNK